MRERVKLRGRKFFTGICLMLFAVCCMTAFMKVDVQAKTYTKNVTMVLPGSSMKTVELKKLKGIPKKNVTIKYGDKSVAKVTAEKYMYNFLEQKIKWPGYYNFIPKKVGESTIKLSAKVKGKKVIYKVNVKILPFEPLETLTINGIDYLSETENAEQEDWGMLSISKDIDLNGSDLQIDYKAASGWKLGYAELAIAEEGGDDNDFEVVGEVKSGEKYPLDRKAKVELSFNHKKANVSFCVYLDITP